MNCFFCDFQDKGYKQYTKQKAYNRNQRVIMDQMGISYPASSEELPEDSWKSQNTYWFGMMPPLLVLLAPTSQTAPPFTSRWDR